MTESQASGVLLGTLQAKDPDEGENGTVFYSLTGILHQDKTTMILWKISSERADSCMHSCCVKQIVKGIISFFKNDCFLLIK